MEMKNVALSTEEQSEYAQDATCMTDAPKYPWGLCITLDDDTIDKLGLAALPAVEQKMILTARVEVTRVSSSDSKDGDKERSVSLQITDMALSADKAPSDPTKVLYGA